MTRTMRFAVHLAVLASVVAMPAAAQWAQPHTDSFPPPASIPMAAAGHREPLLAGALSLVVPFGAGSFYAGHLRHGATHLVVGFLTGTVAMGGALGCGTSALEGSPSEDSCTATQVASLAFVVNWLWGVVSAVNDARAANERARPVRAGSLYPAR